MQLANAVHTTKSRLHELYEDRERNVPSNQYLSFKLAAARRASAAASQPAIARTRKAATRRPATSSDGQDRVINGRGGGGGSGWTRRGVGGYTRGCARDGTGGGNSSGSGSARAVTGNG